MIFHCLKANFFRVQVKNSVMCWHFHIGFIDFMLAGKFYDLVSFTNMFSPYDLKKWRYNSELFQR